MEVVSLPESGYSERYCALAAAQLHVVSTESGFVSHNAPFHVRPCVYPTVLGVGVRIKWDGK